MLWLRVAVIYLLCIASSPAQELPPIQNFVKSVWTGGIPISQAEQYPKTVVPELIHMLGNQREKIHWPQIALVLGVVGNESIGRLLIDHLHNELYKPGECRDVEAFGHISGLGHLVRRTGNTFALNYLITGTDPGIWKNRVKLDAKCQVGEEFYEYLALDAVVALGISESPVAAYHMQKMIETKTAPRGNISAVETWLKVNQRRNATGVTIQ